MGRNRYIVGIDEAGRGPLAGPIAVAALAATIKSAANSKLQFSNYKVLKNIKDSKKLSAKQRLEWLKILKNNFQYKVSMVGPAVIDRIGIQKATRLAVRRVLKKLSIAPHIILLDGSLYAPKHYKQKTIIKGDEKIPIIAAASIAAKVTRDRKMLKLHKDFPEYGFDLHKGYGTQLHYRRLRKHGLSPHHRKTYLKKFQKLRSELSERL